MALYQRIKDLREDEDKTQSEIADFLGTTAQYYGKYEKGEREIPLSRAIELADYYNVSLDYVAGRTNIKNPTSIHSLNDDDLKLLEKFHSLSERNKGKAELFIDQLVESQSNKSHNSSNKT